MVQIHLTYLAKYILVWRKNINSKGLLSSSLIVSDHHHSAMERAAAAFRPILTSQLQKQNQCRGQSRRGSVHWGQTREYTHSACQMSGWSQHGLISSPSAVCWTWGGALELHLGFILVVLLLGVWVTVAYRIHEPEEMRVQKKKKGTSWVVSNPYLPAVQ